MKKRGLVILILGGGLAALGGCGTHTSIGEIGDAASGGHSGQGGGGMMVSDAGTGGQGGGMMVSDAGTGGQGGAGMGLDARADVPPACAAAGGSAPWSQPTSALSFRAGASYPIGEYYNYGFALGDVSGDSKADLVVSGSSGISLFINQGDGSLVGPRNYPFGGTWPYLGDLNGDGKTDVVMTEYAGVSVVINEGNAALEPPVTYVAFAQSIALGDLNGDGKTDIVAQGGDQSGTQAITVFLNTGGGNFAGTSYPTEGIPVSIAIGDLNGDCKPDLAFGESVTMLGGRVSMLLNDGQGAFKPATSHGTGIAGNSITLVDVSGDGKMDMVVGNPATGNVAVLLNYGDGTFTTAVDYAGSGGGFAVGDLNGDGKPDIAAGGGVLLNKGNGTFSPSSPYPVRLTPFWVALSDLDGDGKLDVVLGENLANGAVNVLFNTSH